MNRTKIEWCDFTWNPVTGCKRGCEYCYARRIHDRFNKTPFSEIIYHPHRIPLPSMEKTPSTIFVGSMSDLEYWTNEQKDEVVAACERNQQHTFMFLSKSGLSYFGTRWPSNTLQGLTMTCTQTEHCQYELLNQMRKYPRPFLSIEPILGTLKVRADGFEKVIIGAMSGPGAVTPHPDWIQSIKDNVPEGRIFWKNNIKNFLK